MECALFINIKDFIIECLINAKSKIRVAVAWFTNLELYSIILMLLQKGIQVDLIIIDDYINRNEYGLDFNAFISMGGHLYLSTQAKNMHNKFCIIDNTKVITGSYNWTYYAEKRNWENIITSDDISIVNQYVNEFEDIKSQLSEVSNYRQLKLEEIDPISLLNDYDYLYQDLLYKGNITGVQYSNYLSAIKNNIVIQKNSNRTISHKTQAVMPSTQNAVTLHSLGIRVTIDGNYNCTSFLIPKGTLIPYEKKGVFFTLTDNQTSLLCETLLGESVDANSNYSIGKICLHDIPPLPKGKGSMEVTFKLSSDKMLHVIAKNLHTKTSVEASYNLSNTI